MGVYTECPGLVETTCLIESWLRVFAGTCVSGRLSSSHAAAMALRSLRWTRCAGMKFLVMGLANMAGCRSVGMIESAHEE
ncbi:hypothetical protein BMS3Bbin04_00864 [bacterium BMS3Bbin04]|nr:hypothetical protein BMS3Bbin04_00864 [bacterium BMS3Bbin04]